MTAPIAAWNFDEASGPVLDRSGNGHDFTLSGTSARTAPGGGQIDRGLSQSATTVDPGPAVFGQTANRTIMAWVKQTASVGPGWLFECHDTPDDTGLCGFLYLSTLRFRGRNASGPAEAAIAQPADSNWHHLTGTYDGAMLRLYLDAILVAFAPLTGPIRTDGDVFNVFTALGSGITVDNARFFDVALSQPEIETMMNTPVTDSALSPPTDSFLPFF